MRHGDRSRRNPASTVAATAFHRSGDPNDETTAKNEIAFVNARMKPVDIVWWNILFGIWLAASPFVIGFNNPALRWSNVAVGVAVVVLAVFHPGPVRGFPVVLGAWIFASTFVLGVLRLAAMWNNLILAVLIIVGALASEATLPPTYIKVRPH